MGVKTIENTKATMLVSWGSMGFLLSNMSMRFLVLSSFTPHENSSLRPSGRVGVLLASQAQPFMQLLSVKMCLAVPKAHPALLRTRRSKTNHEALDQTLDGGSPNGLGGKTCEFITPLVAWQPVKVPLATDSETARQNSDELVPSMDAHTGSALQEVTMINSLDDFWMCL